MMNSKPIKLIQVPASQDEPQQALLLMAVERLLSRTSCQLILSFLGHERLDEFNLGFLFDMQDCLGKKTRVGITGLSKTARVQFVGLNLNLQFPLYHLEAIAALSQDAGNHFHRKQPLAPPPWRNPT